MEQSVPFAASKILEVVPSPVRSFLQIAFYYLFTQRNEHTIVIYETRGISGNQLFDAARIYLRTKISPSTRRYKVEKTSRQRNLNTDVEPDQEVRDTFENFHLKWNLKSIKPTDKRFFELIFNKKFNDRVLNEYLPFVLAKSQDIKDNDKVLKLYTRGGRGNGIMRDGEGIWGSIDLEHPSTFETLAMRPELKKAIIDDFDRFPKRRDYYKKVGKAWKRGYLLYGPPSTGKSSLIAAMANYLKFDIYDLELTNVFSDSELRNILLATSNRSILVIEDIDCSMEEIQDRTKDIGSSVEKQNRLLCIMDKSFQTKLTLSGLLNMIDGLCAEGFKFLASNYLDVRSDHQLFVEIENLIENVEVTPTEFAEELMRSEDADVALGGVVNFLKRKQIEANKIKEEKTSAPEHQQAKRLKTDCPKKRAVRKCRKNGCKMSARS
ncbi:hypothetical protein F0562_006369 [Nyssa sinensis]|uniref:AAA+ ATPase domain-containing protein n=1 Tax=Nyssa sinensis TaxID=561372 RepID=A0A5J5ANN5_9ASTE|nr:hypothetical protein F0562_006369 [Nyssa sinensis]